MHTNKFNAQSPGYVYHIKYTPTSLGVQIITKVRDRFFPHVTPTYYTCYTQPVTILNVRNLLLL